MPVYAGFLAVRLCCHGAMLKTTGEQKMNLGNFLPLLSNDTTGEQKMNLGNFLPLLSNDIDSFRSP